MLKFVYSRGVFVRYGVGKGWVGFRERKSKIKLVNFLNVFFRDLLLILVSM